ncbi:DNA-methyltransferase [Olivibacter domesticus]|uniref:Methyltransferase n=1 Tax=Olivibacter domesticus TaxID=407022 RepID=A0A1H7I9J1_OLID1|nr:site-specific DNA-methyltransferase [Olivibacter domesticus]SEK58417.1 site-specific DNA-methyltransferase (adenine-specific) [Olivibacter domesticus]
MEDYVNSVIEGDCLRVMKRLADQSIDMVLCDLPYGITNNPWDQIIDLVKLWKEYKRIIKPNGVIILTSAGRFTGQLIESNPQWFKYKIVWLKSKATNFLNANRQLLRRHEDICVFYKNQPVYNPQKIAGAPYDKGVRRDQKTGTYNDFGTSRSINLSGMRFPCDVLVEVEHPIDWLYFVTAEREGNFHPTQKPVDLARWLIRTYTHPGYLLLDNACGGGSFLVAAVLEGRNFIGIELNDQSYHFGKKVDYVAICRQRIEEAAQQHI